MSRPPAAPAAAAAAAVPPSLGERLQAVTEALAAARTGEDVFRVVLTPALQALDAVAGAVLLVDGAGERLEIAAIQGYLEGAQTLWQDGPLSGNVPAGDALERREPLFFEHQGNLTRAYPELEARTGGVAAVATAVLPMFLDDAPLGVIILDFKEPHGFTAEEGHFLRTLAAQCAIALGRARLMTDLQRQVQERTRRLEADARAQEAFVAFTEAVGTELDIATLAQRAVDVLQTHFVDGIGGYYEREGELWKLRSWTRNLGAQPDFIAALRAGLPSGTPFITELLRERGPVFTEQWDAEHEGIEDSGDYGTVAAYPVTLGGEVRGFFTLGFKTVSRWAERDRAIVRAVGHSLTLAVERAEQARQLQAQNAELEARTLAMERFADLARSQESQAATLIRQAQQLVTELIGGGFSVYYELGGNVWRLRSQVGSPEDETIQASLESALPYETVLNFRIPWESGTPFYQDAYDPALDHGVPGTEALASTAALPLFVGPRRQGMFGYGLKVSRPWTRADRATLETAVTSLGLLLERAEQTRRLEEERAALGAFARFTEASTLTTDALTLAEEARAVLGAALGVEVGYSELEGGLWKGRVFSENTPPEVVAQSRRGFSAELPALTRPFAERDVVFVDGWDPRGAEHTEVYGVAALYPYFAEGRPHGLLTMGTAEARAWTERERSVFRSVGRSLALAFERAEQARQLQVQNAELEARTRALSAFVELTRDLSFQSEPEALIGRALEVVLSLLPPGVALFYQKAGDRWQVTAQLGSLGTPELQAAVEAGLPVGHTPTLDLPDQTGEPLFQDVYDRAQDVAPELVAHLGTVATLPVLVRGEVLGIFNVGLFEARGWSAVDRAVLETAVRSLGLALEGAQGVAQLAQRTRELERSNAELEQFAYIASHDLQAPIRAVTSFAGVIDRRYGERLDERGRLYLRQIMESGEHMKRLVDDLLAFSRLHTQPGKLLPVDAGAVFDAVARRLQPAAPPGTGLTREELPVVLADARQLDQLLQNLISNGLKYARPGIAPRVHVSAERDGDCWRFAVSDNGIGIEGQYFERIFVIFQRLHGRETYEGTGIGLAVCKKIVERHGGRLWLESEVGQGTTFFFTLPEV